jgi:hypothetical protein
VQCISPAVVVSAASESASVPSGPHTTTAPPPSDQGAPASGAAAASTIAASTSSDQISPALGHTNIHAHSNPSTQPLTPPAASLLSRNETPIPPSPLAASITSRALNNGTAGQAAPRTGLMCVIVRFIRRTKALVTCNCSDLYPPHRLFSCACLLSTHSSGPARTAAGPQRRPTTMSF